jgi:hypothetical protein
MFVNPNVAVPRYRMFVNPNVAVPEQRSCSYFAEKLDLLP